MDTIGLVAALPQESGALLKRIKRYNSFKMGHYHGAEFKLNNRHCFLITSGMGIKRARDATRILVEKVNPQLVISFGIAGAVNIDLEIGDVVHPDTVCVLMEGKLENTRTLTNLSEMAFNAAAKAIQLDNAHMVLGTAVTTRGSQHIQKPGKEFFNPILEMETAGIADVAAQYGVPLISIRSISDGPRSPIPINLEDALDDDDNLRISKLFLMVLRRPGIIFRSRQIIRNSRLAADHAALALIGVLSQPDEIIKT